MCHSSCLWSMNFILHCIPLIHLPHRWFIRYQAKTSAWCTFQLNRFQAMSCGYVCGWELSHLQASATLIGCKIIQENVFQLITVSYQEKCMWNICWRNFPKIPLLPAITRNIFFWLLAEKTFFSYSDNCRNETGYTIKKGKVHFGNIIISILFALWTTRK